jgi:hypothetical protein
VRRGDVPGIGPLAELLQAGVADLPCRRLDAAGSEAFRIERPVLDVQRDIESYAEVAYERLVGVGLVAAEMVVHVCAVDLETVVAQLGQCQEESGGVNTPGNSRDQTARFHAGFDEKLTYGRRDHLRASR